MILKGAEAARFLDRPDPSRGAVLLSGADPDRVALAAKRLAAALTGPEAAAEMRIDRIPAAALRTDPARATDALKATGFFPGQRLVWIEEAGDAQAGAVRAALEAMAPGDAFLLVTAGALRKGSALIKAFASHTRAAVITLYPDPPGPDAVAAALARAGLPAGADPAALDLLTALAADLSQGEFEALASVLALHEQGADRPLDAATVRDLAPETVATGIDAAIEAAADGRVAALGPALLRLGDQGVQPVALTIQAARHFRTLLAACTHPAGPAEGLARARPPIFGPRRDRILAQIRRLGPAGIERAVAILHETDLALRSPRGLPARGLIERALIRIAHLGRPAGRS